MRRSITVAAALGLTLGLAACSSSAKPGDTTSSADTSVKTTLTVWVDETRAPAIKAVATQFTADTGTEFTFVQKTFSEMKDAFIAQAPTGKGPDIIVGANDWTGAFVQNGVVEKVDLGDKASGFNDAAIKGLSAAGQLYGLPYATENIGLVRNTALVPDEPKGSFDDLIAQGQAMVTAGKALYPVIIQQGPGGDAYHLYPIQSSFGSSVFGLDANGDYNPKDLKIGDAAGLQFASYVKKLGSLGILSKDINGDAARDLFAQGKSPFMITGSWYIPDFTKAGVKVAVSPIPSAGGKTAAPFVGVQGFFLNSKSTNKVVSQKLFAYLATEPAQSKMFEVGGRVPALKAAAAKAASDPTVGGFAKAGEAGQAQPQIAAMGAVWEDWGLAEVSIAQGADPAATWTAATASITAKIAAS
jgi:arabinogalactan oligomer/maltooligosaccharide transport system substrate-binding protein